MINKYLVLSILGLGCIQQSNGQLIDSTKIVELMEVEIKGEAVFGGMERMPDLKDNVLYVGKKSEVILLSKIGADLSTNNSRQVFAKVPGMSVWENDGSGIQVGVASRGLSPNRSWEFNVRQNGYDICSEIFGYPESYYSPPMESLEKIEVVRGAASLQYGPQFGGLLNYQTKKGNPNKAISFETQQTVGSYGLINNYNALGGTYKKFSYYAFLHNRRADGWRDNSEYNIYTAYFSAVYRPTKKIEISAEYTNMDYKSQQAGGLTDLEFKENAQQSSRERNWFSTPWNVASVNFKYDVSKAISFQLKSFTTISQRNSVGFTKAITVRDSINPNTLEYTNRQVDRDYYKNFGTEARLSAKYKILGRKSILAGGVRAYSGNTERNQQGQGTTGSDFDLSLINPQYGKALQFSTTNYALFMENAFEIGGRLKLVPGARFELIENTTNGYINTTESGSLSADKRLRSVFLYGLGAEFKTSTSSQFYANYSLAYRPVTFSELSPSATTETIDPNLKDANGFNADFGYRGKFKNFLQFDVGLFYLNYSDRIGTINLNNAAYKTNIGTSASKGIESYIELDITNVFNEKSPYGNLKVFSSNALIDAKYVQWNNPDPSKSIQGKRVENAPSYIHRFGFNYEFKGFSANIQASKVSEVYTDAANTEIANNAATIGKLEGYTLLDMSLAYSFLEIYNLKAGINNLRDANYATRRAGGYPGPGLLPGTGRTFYLSIGATL